MTGEKYPPIGDYAIVGDCRTAALISRSGALDWLCLPRFDSPALFAALLDRRRGGTFRISPAGRFGSRRRYLGRTNVLETTFEAAGGELRLVDLMPVASEEDKRRHLTPDHELLRRLECTGGEVEVEVVCDPRPDYGRRTPQWHESPLGFVCVHGGDALMLRSDAPLALGEEPGVRGRFVLRAGEARTFALSYAHREPLILPLLGDAALERVERSLAWWERWANRCTYRGDYGEAVLRSALTLKLLTYAPSGAIVAAPTASLPEKIGGVRNWDYRYCWLRDAALTLRALFDIGYMTEGEAFLGWLIHTTRMTRPELQVLYDVYGDTRLDEEELDHLEGYAGSRPVRIGNGAQDQLQLDLYGKVADAAYRFVERGGELDRDTRKMLLGVGETVCKRWHEPDEGIWEIRNDPKHHTLSKAMCWVALDRLIKLDAAGHLEVDGARLARERDAIREAVETRGYNEEVGAYVHAFDGEHLDAGLLLLPMYGYLEADDPRARSTLDRIREELGTGPLIHRYKEVDDGLPPGEGAFGICSFWAVENLAMAGRVEEATEDFEALLGYANDVGLFAEEIHPETGAALGNFPQAFTHIGLIDAALTLAECQGQMEHLEQRHPGAHV